jgi:hypothetical protein
MARVRAMKLCCWGLAEPDVRFQKQLKRTNAFL